MDVPGLRETIKKGLPELNDEEIAAVCRSWINECGGPLPMLIEEEIKQQEKGITIETDPDLFEATSNVFKKGGLPELEHLMWRESQMRTACKVEYMRIFAAINPGFTTEGEEQTTRSSPFKIPSVSRKQLETAAADEFVRNRTSYTLATVSFIRDADTTPPDKTQEEEQKTDLPAALTYDDLEEEDLDAGQVVDRLLNVTMHGSSTSDKEDQRPTLISNLRQAATRALKKTEAGTVSPPVRVCQTSAGDWWNVAVVRKGRGGRNGGNKYRFIKSRSSKQDA